jgi:transcription initiation factor TFIID subunit 2
MTIRIHEADGTPYEHIVEIKEATTKFDIPYNTKYKRLKRSRRQKERNAAGPTDFSAENQDDVLLYCLGDVLQTEEDIQNWRLSEWTKEDEDRMSQESYEWIRMDADFEWICKVNLSMPGYMWLSQLQQDRDVVAQLEVTAPITWW